IFFTLMVAGLSSKLPAALFGGLTAQGVPAATAAPISHLPPIGVLFASFLGYNPIQQLLGPVLHQLPASQADFLTGRSFFPSLISGPFADGLTVAFLFAIVACLIGAVASLLCSPRQNLRSVESPGTELAAVAGESGLAPAELVAPVIGEGSTRR
ncbi:MAG TPA: MFS transporter, partial [Pseudonocardiaceae bacterium]